MLPRRLARFARSRPGAPLLRSAVPSGRRRFRGGFYDDDDDTFESDTCFGREGLPLTEYASESSARRGKRREGRVMVLLRSRVSRSTFLLRSLLFPVPVPVRNAADAYAPGEWHGQPTLTPFDIHSFIRFVSVYIRQPPHPKALITCNVGSGAECGRTFAECAESGIWPRSSGPRTPPRVSAPA